MSVFFTRRGEVPNLNKLASDYAVGESVFLNVGGVSREFLVVQQGNPDATMYDNSCDGTWLLMKDIYESRAWNSFNNDYKNSDIHAYLNGDFLSLFDVGVQSTIKTVKIPYVDGNGGMYKIASGSNGLSTKAFLLSDYEVGWTTSNNSNFSVDGACLFYFKDLLTTDAKRIAYLNDTKKAWWTRSPYKGTGEYVWQVYTNGGHDYVFCSNSQGVRPALILPSNVLFDSRKNTFKGV